MMGGVPSQPVAQNLAGLWGGQGFGGLGSPGAVGSLPNYAVPPGGVPLGPRLQQLPGANPGAVGIDPSRDFNFAAPGTTGGPQQTIGPGGQQPGLWDRIMRAVGQGAPLKMPGTTFGAPAGAAGSTGAPLPPPPMLPQTQMPAPPGMGAYFRSLQNPAAAPAGSQGLMQQYAALQQLMRGA